MNYLLSILIQEQCYWGNVNVKNYELATNSREVSDQGAYGRVQIIAKQIRHINRFSVLRLHCIYYMDL